MTDFPPKFSKKTGNSGFRRNSGYPPKNWFSTPPKGGFQVFLGVATKTIVSTLERPLASNAACKVSETQGRKFIVEGNLFYKRTTFFKKSLRQKILTDVYLKSDMVTARGRTLCWPCGAKKPTRHPLRRPSSAELFGAIAQKNTSNLNTHIHTRQYCAEWLSRIYRGPCLQRLASTSYPGRRVGFFAPQGFFTDPPKNESRLVATQYVPPSIFKLGFTLASRSLRDKF